MKIHSWQEISDNFTDGLILGNGASIAFDQRFRYSSLLARAKENGLISTDVQQVFSHLDTVDFELVLRMLWHSNMINNALDISDDRTKEAYISVRRALIDIVREIHVEYDDVKDSLQLASSFMRQFSTIGSLSYDVLVYWAILKGNEQIDTHRFKDCFVNGHFREDWEELRTNIPPCEKTTIVSYPHGNLAIAVDIYGTEVKISSDLHEPLLESVFYRWTNGDLAPVFVSEGTTIQKLSSISRSHYLSTVYHQILPDITESLVLFGWSINDNDIHILDSICRGQPNRFALAVNPNNPNLEIHTARLNQMLSERIRSPDFELILFDRSSSGCWINP
jgi:hypothetical protein